MKTEVLHALGQAGSLSPAQLNAALAANDRVKFYFSLLQMALGQAAHPEQPAPSLRRERIACGLKDGTLDNAIADARSEGGACRLPGAAGVLRLIKADMRIMAAPVLASAAGREAFAERLEARLTGLPEAGDDLLHPPEIEAMTRPGSASADSLHQLVIDLHKRLNLLQADLAEEVLAGASAYAVTPMDRGLIQAFMAGVNRTAGLKFNHPGLATTATRADGRLMIQNDIGTTDAHVLVIHVEDLTVTITHTDVHPERLQFFKGMLDAFPVAWEPVRTMQTDALAEGAPFHLASGRFAAPGEVDCQRFLEHLGSRLVFLIDWNRARKQLRGFLRGPQRIKVLRWAAQADIGHRGFLELGGARLVNQAIEAARGAAMHFGDRLCDVLGEAETVAFFQFVLKAASEGMQARQSHSLIRDRVRAQLQQYFSTIQTQLLRLAADHAALVFDLASLARDGLSGTGEAAERRSRRGKRFEHDADQLVIEVREMVRRRPDHAVFRRVLEIADDAADGLEDAVFLLGLFPPADGHGSGKGSQGGDAVAAQLQALGDTLVDAAQDWVRAVGHAGHIQDPGGQEDAEGFLTAVDAIGVAEQRADELERALTVALVSDAGDFRQLHVAASIGAALEAASDALKLASLVLRDHVLGEVIGG